MRLENKADCSPVYSTDSQNAWCSLPLPLMPDVSSPESLLPHPLNQPLSSRSIFIVHPHLHIGFPSSLFPSDVPTKQCTYKFIFNAWHMCQPISSTFIWSSSQYLARSTVHKFHHMMQLSTFSSYFLSLMSKYFTSISSLTLSIICIASNELQSLTDAVL
jgi:hypothetical protein